MMDEQHKIRPVCSLSDWLYLSQTPTKRRSQQRPGRPPKPSVAVALAASQACGGAPPLLRQPKRGGARRAASPIPAPPDPHGGSPTTSAGNDASPGGALGSLVETAAQLGELHAELESGHARVQAAIAGGCPALAVERAAEAA